MNQFYLILKVISTSTCSFLTYLLMGHSDEKKLVVDLTVRFGFTSLLRIVVKENTFFLLNLTLRKKKSNPIQRQRSLISVTGNIATKKSNSLAPKMPLLDPLVKGYYPNPCFRKRVYPILELHFPIETGITVKVREKETNLSYFFYLEIR